MPAFGYRRQPAESGTDPSAAARSFEAQGMAVAAASARHQLELTAMYSERDDGTTQWRALLRDAAARAHEADPPAIVIPSLRVLAERTRDRLVRALQAHASGVPVLLGSDERLPDAMLTTWNDRAESDRHADHVRQGMQRRALRGFALGRPPYGYRVRDHRLELEPAEAELVRELVRLYLEDGLGVRRIAGVLNDRGLVTRQGRPWSATAVRDILRNPTYLGTSHRLGVIVSAAHEPILTRRDFEAVQRAMSQRRTAPAEQHRHEYLLSGLARCGYCGNRLIGVRRPGADGQLVYYQCESATNQGRCGYHSRRVEELEDEVRARLASAPTTRGLVLNVAHEVERLEARRRGLHREIDRALALWSSGEWRSARMLSEAGPRALADLEVEAALEALAQAQAEPPDAPGALQRRLIEDWDALPFDERRALLRRLVTEIVVTDDAVHLTFTA